MTFDKTRLIIAELIENVIIENGLSSQNVAFQLYEFASNMSGK